MSHVPFISNRRTLPAFRNWRSRRNAGFISCDANALHNGPSGIGSWRLAIAGAQRVACAASKARQVRAGHCRAVSVLRAKVAQQASQLCCPWIHAGVLIRHEVWRRKASEKPSKEQPTFDELAESVEFDNPEAKEVLSKVTAAAEQVAAAQSKKKDLQKEIDSFNQEAEAKRIEEEAQKKADKILADAEVRASEKLVKAAELQLQGIELEKERIRRDSIQDLERIESLKAGALAVVGGAVSLAPLIWASGASFTSGTLTLLAGLASCGLFGITYRYAVSADVENRQLKSGVVTAFGLVRALGQADTIQLLKGQQGVGPIDADVIGPGLLGAGQSVILFGFAAIAIEASFRFGLLQPFGSVGEEQD